MAIVISISVDEKVAKYLARLREHNINISKYINKLIIEDMHKNGE